MLSCLLFCRRWRPGSSFSGVLGVAPRHARMCYSMKRALVCGTGGFIGGHLVKKLKREGYWVRGVDIKPHESAPTRANKFMLRDLRNPDHCRLALTLSNGVFDEVYQLAADMGGMGFISVADCEVLHNNALINIHMTHAAPRWGWPATSSHRRSVSTGIWGLKSRRSPKATASRPTRTTNTAGRSCMPSGWPWPTGAVTRCRYASPVSRTATGLLDGGPRKSAGSPLSEDRRGGGGWNYRGL